MRILFLTHSFNSLAQRLYLELTRRGHEVSIEFDIHDDITRQAISLFQPDLILAPYLKRPIPASVWSKIPCFIVHPGIRGDRGPSSLDWAILNQELQWGVTVLQANQEMDAGDIWAEETFTMRKVRKSTLYRNEVTETAVKAVLSAIEKYCSKSYGPEPQRLEKLKPLMTQKERKINWAHDSSQEVLRKLHSADGSPGISSTVLGQDLRLFNGILASDFASKAGPPGSVISWNKNGILLATIDGAIWVTHASTHFKLPVAQILQDQLMNIQEGPGPEQIRFTQKNAVGVLEFDFYNGAMGTEQCMELRSKIIAALKKDIRVLVLLGSEDFWSNGIYLHAIEAAKNPADESWRNIEAMNDLAETIINAKNVITISALQGNAGAGGFFLALASDFVFARQGVVLNPHYKSMGNLYGSEYWTYSLPKRIGEDKARLMTEARLPIDVFEAKKLGLIDAHFATTHQEFLQETLSRAQALSLDPEFTKQIGNKVASQEETFSKKPLRTYRNHEMEQMNLNFYGFDPSYHIARYNFVHRVPHSHTPRHLAKHRNISISC